MYLPGTVITVDDLSSQNVQSAFSHIFLAGGLVLSQVAALSGMENHTVQNWVKRGFCSSPVSKKYSKGQFCRLITVNALKDSMTINEITKLISYVNGRLDDESDDIVADEVLYFMFVELIHRTDGHTGDFDREINGVLDCFTFDPEARQRLVWALKVMLYANKSAWYKKAAEDLIKQRDGE